ncbi:MAG: integrin alpha, partial [Candidatus Omnitrophica bacterium]|nr:integrin alpha [Candidatus Omnitrophota bacterium]
MLPKQPEIDLDGDRIHDLIVGAPSADGFISGMSKTDAGKIYVIYGSYPSDVLPTSDYYVIA